MATKQKFLTGKVNLNGQKTYFLEGTSQELTSNQYTLYLETQIKNFLNLKPASREDDYNGVDFYSQDNKKIQLKILHNGKSSFTLPYGILEFNKNKNIHKDNYYTFRNALKKYASKFDALCVYFGDSNIGSKFDENNIILIEGKSNIYEFLFLRTYRGYAQSNNASAQFNKTNKSDLTQRFLTEQEAEKMLKRVNDNIQFIGSCNSKRVKLIKRKYLQFDKNQKFREVE